MGRTAEILSFKPESEGALATVLWKVPPGRPKNADIRDREHLTADEVASLIDAAGKVFGPKEALTRQVTAFVPQKDPVLTFEQEWRARQDSNL